ncbi:hypothetical protein GS909_13460 [Rhodococcus hoagii]|nr:hypothetical protein [Prescottella equi]
MGAEQFRERGPLRLAEFGELLRDVRDRAVVLTDLHTVADRTDRGGETGRGERLGDLLRRRLDGLRFVVVDRSDRTDDRLHPATGEVLDGRVSTDLAQLTHGRAREIVVRVAELSRGPPP